MIGIIGKKCGMTRIFTEDGKSIPVTIVQANPNVINRIKTKKSDGYDAIQVTSGILKSKNSKPNKGQFNINNSESSTKLHEFRISDYELDKVEAGKEISVGYFSKGEKVDVSGTTIGKGYAGVIKRHNFSMQDATHGNSLAHRAHGSIGQNQTPGRVFKGKKMSGHMGNVRRTMQNLEVVEIDSDRNLLFIKGSIVGHNNSDIVVTPAIKSEFKEREIFPIVEEETTETAAPEAEETTETAAPEAEETAAPEAEETTETAAPEAEETTETAAPEAEETTETAAPEAEKKDK
jgi:large subunit ribosomal protein L3